MSEKAKLLSALEQLQSISCAGGTEEVPEGWKTTEQWANLMDLSPVTIGARIRSLVKSGEWEQRKFRVVAPSGSKIYPTPHYRPVNGK